MDRQPVERHGNAACAGRSRLCLHAERRAACGQERSYTFYTTSDDGIRLWVNNVQVINNWTDHARTEDVGSPIVLNAGQAYSIQLEYYERGGQCNVSLSWSSSSQPKQVVPTAQLRAAP